MSNCAGTTNAGSAPVSTCGSAASHRSRTPVSIETNGGTLPTDPADLGTATFDVVSLDVSKGKNFYLELLGSCVDIQLSGVKSGRRGTVIIKNDLTPTAVADDADPFSTLVTDDPATWADNGINADPNTVKYIRFGVPDGYNACVFIGNSSFILKNAWGLALLPQQFACLRYYYNGPSVSDIRPMVELLLE